MKHNILLEILGFRFVVNKRSGEIHDVKHLHKNCNFNFLKRGVYISKKKVNELTKEDINKFCRWCNR